MISRIQSRILPGLNVHCRFLFNVKYDNDSSHLNNERLKINEETDIPDFAKTQNEPFQAKHKFTVDKNGFVHVFTDGSCTYNGSVNAKAGFGVWFNNNHPLNISQPIVGRSTCNVAEITAVTEAIKQANKAGIKKLKIHTDSQFVINCVKDWMPKWKLTGWRTSLKKPVINKNELMELDNVLSSIEVDWVHVPSHSGVYGNEMANNLAKEGIFATKSTN